MQTGARLSIGAKLALRYTAVMSVTLTVVALFVYTQVEHRVNREAKLLLQVQAADLIEALASQRREHAEDVVLAWLDDHAHRIAEHADPSLKLGIEFRSESGERVLAAGSLTGVDLPIPRTILDGEQPSQLRAVNLGDEFAFLSIATRVPGGILRLVMNTERYADNIDHIRDVFLLSLPLVVALSALGGWLLARGSLRPISQITRTARRISGSTPDERVPLTGSGDELDQLAGTLNEMLGRIHGNLARMRRFNANAAHELRTPLAALSNEVEVTLEKPRTDEEYREVLGDVVERVRGLAAGVDAMLRLARSEAGLDPEHRTLVELRPILETVYDFFAPLAEDNGISLRLVSAPHAEILGDASWLHQLFSNLVSNALKFTPKGGSVDVTGLVDAAEARVRVRDTGSGISGDQLERIFDRYERGEGERSPGFGLGLAIAQEIARAHGGWITVSSPEGCGATFEVGLPLAPPAGERA